MNESQRQAYLQAMGIQLVYPRQPLAAARPSPAYQWQPESAPGSDPAFDAVAKAPVRKPAAPSAAEPAPPDRVEPEHDLAPAPAAPIATGQEPAATDSLRFRLRYFSISDRLAVIDEYPWQQDRSAGAEALSLLRNILAALGQDLAGRELTGESFDWPLAEDLELDIAATAAARQALAGFITKRRQDSGFSNLLVFAGQVRELLAGDETAGDFLSGDGSYHITLTETLQSMLSHPVLKRDAWQQLQPLRQRLAN